MFDTHVHFPSPAYGQSEILARAKAAGGADVLAVGEPGLDHYISFSGILAFASAAALRDACRHIPLDRLLVETDCPCLAPVPLQGRRNEPSFVVHTARRLSGQRNPELSKLERITDANARRLLGVGRQR